MGKEITKLSSGVAIRGDVLRPASLKLAKYPLIIADPPYGKILDEDWDDWGYDEYIQLAVICRDLLVNGGSAYIWGGIGKPGNRTFFKFLAHVESETGLALRNVITWSKKRAYGKKDDYLFTREEIAWLVNGDKPSVFHIPLLDVERGYAGYSQKYPAKSKFKRRTNVWTDVTEVLRNKKHVAEKPERLAEIMIETHTDPGDTVLDLFSGSGNVSAAAERLGRRFVAVERDKHTFASLVGRLAA
jgi:DNA modification methylase